MKDVLSKVFKIFKTLSMDNHSMIFHLALVHVPDQLGHFSASVFSLKRIASRGVSLVRLSFILSGNSKPAFSPTQALLKDILPALGKI